MTETERSGLLSQRTASPIEPVSNGYANGKLDVKDVGEEDTDGDSRKEKVYLSYQH